MIIGIDLGTSTSEAAFVNEKGQVIVVPDRDGGTIIPSIVYIKHNGRAVVGSAAGEYLFTRRDSTFMEVKRIFGTGEKLMAHGKIYSPEEIQAHIIGHLVDNAEDYTGEDVTGVVITVPAYFTDNQRKQTVRAGELAGVSVERIINEPTAAAMDYGLQNIEENENILVYDFGGGTLDVTVLELFGGVIDVKSSSGNNRLGGKDFDELLMKHIAGGNYAALMADDRAAMKLKQAATECKIALSSEDETTVRLPLIAGGISIDKTVTRSGFEGLIRTLVESTGEQIDAALRDAQMEPADLQRLIFVGGTTRIPMVRKFVEDKLGIKHVPGENGDYSPELMVARGAAIQAAIIGGVIGDERSVVLSDVCPFTLGMKVVTSKGIRVDPLIRRNVKIPHEFSKVYYAVHYYQRTICVEIYQGESVFYHENTKIGEMDLENLPQRRDELASVEVTFAYDVNGLLEVTARAVGNNKTATTTIDINSGSEPAKPAVKLSMWKNAEGAPKYRPLLRKVEKIIGGYAGTEDFMENHLYEILDICDNLKANLILGDKEGAEKEEKKLKEWLEYWEAKENK